MQKTTQIFCVLFCMAFLFGKGVNSIMIYDAIVIGGASVYMALLGRCDRVCVTKVLADADADSFFPRLDDNPDWGVASESEVFEENGLKFQFVDYVRNH